MVAVGVASALAVQQLLFRAAGLPALSGLTVSLLAAGAGGAGAKAWYMLLDREHGRHRGWCIQGFVAALLLVLMIGGPVIGVPIGTFLDLSTPPLFLGMAIGRLGCLMAGCCGGRPTCSRFGIWCSDQRIGVKRIPTQLLESALSLATFAVTVGIVISSTPSAGAVFVGAVAAYTLVRQLLLRFRAEARRTTAGTWVTAAVAAAMLVLVTATPFT